MSDEELDQEAAALHAAYAAERGPAWHLLGEVTKSVWYGYALAGVGLP